MFYGSSKDRTGKELFTATVIPNRGAWLEYETDSNDVFYVRIDKNRKLPVTTLIRALGLSTDEQIKEFFGDDRRINATIEKDITHNTEEGLLEVYRKLRPGEPPTVESSQSHLNALFFDPRRYDLSRVGRYKIQQQARAGPPHCRLQGSPSHHRPPDRRSDGRQGEKLNLAKAEEIEHAGVTRVAVWSRRRARRLPSRSSPTAWWTSSTTSALMSMLRPASTSASASPCSRDPGGHLDAEELKELLRQNDESDPQAHHRR